LGIDLFCHSYPRLTSFVTLGRAKAGPAQSTVNFGDVRGGMRVPIFHGISTWPLDIGFDGLLL
jgi:hypothetical protein